KYDEWMNLRTIPQRIGITSTKILSISIFTFSLGIFVFLTHIAYLGQKALLSFALATLIGIILVLGISIKRSEYYYSLLMESCLMLPFLLYTLINCFFPN